MAYVARKRITLAGVRYGPGEVVPLHELKLTPKLVRQMLDQRKLVLRRDAGPAAGSAPPKLEQADEVAENQAAEEEPEADEQDPEDEEKPSGKKKSKKSKGS